MSTHSQNSSPATPFGNTNQMPLTWWATQSQQGLQPILNMQRAWLEGMMQAAQLEMQFFYAVAESQSKITQCLFENQEAPKSAADISSCYQEVMQDLTQAHFDRLKRVSELSLDFRRAIWEEI